MSRIVGSSVPHGADHAADALWFSVAEYACDSTHTRDGLEGRSGSSAGGRHPQGNRGWAGGAVRSAILPSGERVSDQSSSSFRDSGTRRALHVVQAYALLNLIPASRIVPKIWAASCSPFRNRDTGRR